MWISILLSLMGLMAIFLEFFLPGGLFALIGGILIIAGVSLFSISEAAISYKFFYFAANMLATFAMCKAALRMIRNRKKSPFFLKDDQEGFTASVIDENFFGLVAEAATDLKPSGHIEIEGQRFQALSEGSYIPKGKQIKIIRGQGAYYIVREEE